MKLNLNTFFLALLLPFYIFGNSLNFHEWSLEKKIGQMIIVHFHGTELNEESKRYIDELNVSGFIFYSWSNKLENPSQVKNLTKSLQDHSPTALFFATDQEGGRVNRLSNGFTIFPSNKMIADTSKPQQARDNAFITGTEMKAVGININLAPVVDVNVNPKNPVIGDRSYSADPKIVVTYARQCLLGFRDAKVITAIKHFPGHGDVTVDSHKDLPTINKTRKELNEIELYPFAQLVNETPMILTAHLLVPALDSEYSATVSKKIITDLLRMQLGFKGVIITDSLAMKGLIKSVNNINEAAILALLAGHDILLLGGNQLLTKGKDELNFADVNKIVDHICEAVRSGRISENRINESLTRIIKLKEDYLIN